MGDAGMTSSPGSASCNGPGVFSPTPCAFRSLLHMKWDLTASPFYRKNYISCTRRSAVSIATRGIWLLPLVLVAVGGTGHQTLVAAQEEEKETGFLDTIATETWSVESAEPMMAKPASQEDYFKSLLTDPAGSKAAREAIWLHRKVKGTCAWLYAEHEHEVYTTLGKNGPRVPVPKLTLHSWVGGLHKGKDCPNAGSCARTEHEYTLGCRRSCVQGEVAQKDGSTHWKGGQSCIW